MNVIGWIVVLLAVVAVVVLLVWMWIGRQRPERAAASADSASAPRRNTDDPSKVVDRPADAGAEDQDVGVGDARPGRPGPPA
jgi:hypothetical protein